jgi:type I restriction-modification system DNA methylase subunit
LWSVADLLRGDYKQADYGKVILPLTVLRRLDCVLEKTKEKVLAKHAELKKAKHPEGTVEKMLPRASGQSFYNTSRLDFGKLKGDPNNVAANLTSYIKGFSTTARDVIEQFKFADQIAKLDEGNLLYQVVGRFAEVDLHPDRVPNHLMGSIFEELIRRFAEASRQVRFIVDRDDSVDVVLFVNGLPVATAELKNPMTNQTVTDAVAQYRRRDPRHPLFAFRSPNRTPPAWSTPRWG